jgi:hypothetical protein
MFALSLDPKNITPKERLQEWKIPPFGEEMTAQEGQALSDWNLQNAVRPPEACELEAFVTEIESLFADAKPYDIPPNSGTRMAKVVCPNFS